MDFLCLNWDHGCRFPCGVNTEYYPPSGKILKGDELDLSDVTKVEDSEIVENAIEVNNGSFSWDKSEEPVLKDIDLDIKKGIIFSIRYPLQETQSEVKNLEIIREI